MSIINNKKAENWLSSFRQNMREYKPIFGQM